MHTMNRKVSDNEKERKTIEKGVCKGQQRDLQRKDAPRLRALH